MGRGVCGGFTHGTEADALLLEADRWTEPVLDEVPVRSVQSTTSSIDAQASVTSRTSIGCADTHDTSSGRRSAVSASGRSNALI